MNTHHDATFDDGDTLGGRIVRARDLAGQSAEEVAAQAGVTLETYTEWENDRAEPRANKLMILAGILGVSPVWMISGKGAGPEAPGLDSAIAEMQAEIGRLRDVASQLTMSADTLQQRLDALAAIARS